MENVIEKIKIIKIFEFRVRLICKNDYTTPDDYNII